MRNLDQIMEMNSHLIHSFADLHSIKQDGGPTVITGAEGAYVVNSEGEKMLDGIGGLWCVNIGHGRREIIDAITKQLHELDYYSTFYNLTHPLAAELADKITSLAPDNLNHVYFANSGSVANDTAIRILHHYYNRIGKPKKKKILSRIGAYHGSTHLAIAMTTPAYRIGWDSAEELVHHLSSPLPYRRPDGMTEEEFCDHLIDEMKTTIEGMGAENIACFIAEPVMGAGGVILPPEGYHQRAEAVMRAYDIKTISDEVVTAFCRLGPFFASEEVFQIRPDIITSAKGLTSGYQPMSATLISDEIYEVISAPGDFFLHGMTYSGHPACCAAALANIALMEQEDLPNRVKHTGKCFENTMKGLLDLDIVGDVRGSHFMIGIEFVSDKATKQIFGDDIMIGKRVAREAQARGLVVRPLGHMAVLSPPLILTETQIDQIGTILRESIMAVQNQLG
ncbi:MAG: aminotransferase class III-fold pyridoxal phosphate-dependent enzyme [Proteobacteria bacterium]|nr:aminotransferase class III-fold pyridoxal phosphate-dependent enzyme [Pseudomonadota bacterium]MDA1319701.1 aminotransferase class III-fold pyridoxal phosphate-dependent enzyme [Pseudomonadota bacterium]